MKKQRLSKILAASGVASRRHAEEIIFSGCVTVNGEVALVPQTMCEAGKDKILVNGKPIQAPRAKIYYILNKPKGYLCTAADILGKRVIDLFDEKDGRLFTAGRLDKYTTGILIVTNDGHFANRVIHPSSNIEKEYIAKVDRDITHDDLVAISKGCRVEDVFIKPVRVEKVRKSTIKVIVGEGKKREVRLLLQGVGFDVRELKRIRIGRLLLGDLAEGAFRTMTEREKELIFEK